VASVFDEGAREHARRLTRSGRLEPDMIVGRWWSTSGAPVEIDVLGLVGKRARLAGEAKWSGRPLSERELARLSTKVVQLPNAGRDTRLALWGAAGVAQEMYAGGY
jgi:hypothetical protein